MIILQVFQCIIWITDWTITALEHRKKSAMQSLQLVTTTVDYGFDVEVENIQIQNEEFCKYLGIIIDENLKWSLQIEGIYRS